MLWAKFRNKQHHQRWLIIGSDQQPGEAIALTLAKAGHQIVAHGQSTRNLQNLMRAIRSSGGHGEMLTAPLQSASDGEQLVTDASKGGALHGVCFITENRERLMFTQTSPQKLSHQLDSMLTGPASVLLAAVPKLKKHGGQVIAVCSLAAVMPFPGHATYAAAQSGWYALLKSVRSESKLSELPVSVIVPGMDVSATSSPEQPRLPSSSSATDIAAAVLQTSKRPRYLTILGWQHRLGHLAYRLAPQSFEQALQVVAPITIPGFAQARQGLRFRLLDQLIVDWRRDATPQKVLKD